MLACSIYSSLDVNYQNLDLSSSMYLITGAAGNLGASISQCLARLGAEQPKDAY